MSELSNLLFIAIQSQNMQFNMFSWYWSEWMLKKRNCVSMHIFYTVIMLFSSKYLNLVTLSKSWAHFYTYKNRCVSLLKLIRYHQLGYAFNYLLLYVALHFIQNNSHLCHRKGDIQFFSPCSWHKQIFFVQFFHSNFLLMCLCTYVIIRN